MIEAHNLTKRYGEQAAVSDLSFTVEPGTSPGSSAWLHANAATFGGDPTHVSVAGESTGGNELPRC